MYACLYKYVHVCVGVFVRAEQLQCRVWKSVVC